MLKRIRGLKIKAILFGFLVDTIGTMAVAFVLLFAMAERGFSENEVATRMHGPSGLLLMLLLGLGFTVVGGYVAGRTARQAEILHGAAVAAIGMVLGLFLREPGLPLWYEAFSFAAMIPAGMAGGYLAGESNTKRKVPGGS